VIKHYRSTLYGPSLFRTDKVIPDVSVESVDKIVWEYFEFEEGEQRNNYTNTTEDRTTIEELFDLFENGEKTENFEPIEKGSKDYVLDIYLHISDIPAVYYLLEIGLDNGRFVCGKPLTGYVYMPDDLLEKIAGKKIDIDELLAE